MKRNCPTIQELLALDAVARHASMSDAARALCITPSAVSKQLAGLELFLGRPVLQRAGRGVQLTALGRAYWQQVAGALQTLETATFDARSGGNGAGGSVITLASVPTFLTQWLIPRLPGFRQAVRGGATFGFSRHLEPGEAIPPGVDAAIRYGANPGPGVVSEYIAGREFVLVASPTRLPGGQCIDRPQDITGHTLLHHEGAPGVWRQWAAQHGLDAAALPASAGPRFAQYSALIRAAASGLGVALVPRILVADDELAGPDAGLAVCGEAVVVVDQGHYLCYRADRLERPVFAEFRAWVLREGAAG